MRGNKFLSEEVFFHLILPPGDKMPRRAAPAVAGSQFIAKRGFALLESFLLFYPRVMRKLSFPTGPGYGTAQVAPFGRQVGLEASA